MKKVDLKVGDTVEFSDNLSLSFDVLTKVEAITSNKYFTSTDGWFHQFSRIWKANEKGGKND